MAVKKDRQKSKRRLSQAVRSKTQRLHAVVEKPPPALERAHQSSATSPALDFRNPRFTEEIVASAAADKEDRLPSVMLVITVLAVIFIGLITWFVAQMPEK